MLRLIVFTLFIAALGGLAAWLAEHPGQVTLLWLGWRIDTSAAFMLACTLTLAACGTAVFSLARYVLVSPRRWRGRRRSKRSALGLNAVTHSLIAFAEGDMQNARRRLEHAKNYLGEAPITLLLTAQLARREDRPGEVRAVLEAMLEHQETRLLAARGLSEYHDTPAQAAQALPHAQAAYALKRRDLRQLRRLISVHTRLGQWQEAQHVLKRALLTAPAHERRRLSALVYCAQAQKLEREGALSSALPFARLAARQLPDFIPAYLLIATLAQQGKQEGQALAALQQGWKKAPHPLLAHALLALLKQRPPAEVFKIVRKTVRTQQAHEESHLLLAEAATRAKAWSEARLALKAALAVRESVRACTLMATLETAQYGDTDASAKWSLRATAGAPDPQWTCEACAHIIPAWQPHCPRCEGFDTLQWKRRALRYAAD